ncbi:cytochrome c biogenesis protein CcsA [Alicyclobacillus cycloheptanicus]|nr:cytochrome c biogenesis protein CcsA [Alicyclobacillus cycloheptanicus]
MGNLVRIMYFHVSSAWIAFLAIGVTFVCTVLYLFTRNLRFDRIAVSSAELGLFYTSITLVTGSLWARPIWNTWWTWDPRLTTTLILWFLYLGYLLLRGTMEGVERRARISGIYAIIASIDVPIIHMSVTWWRSIHPNVINESGFNMPGPMVVALMFGFFTFFCIYVLLLVLRVRLESQRARLYALREQVRDIRAQEVPGAVSLQPGKSHS